MGMQLLPGFLDARLGLVAALLFPLAPVTSAQAQAQCLEIDFNGVYPVFWNSCSYGIDVDFTDENTCFGWRCSAYVSPYGRFVVQPLVGNVRWFACRSDGNGAVIARCDSTGICNCS
jgi:hypothetical protein